MKESRHYFEKISTDLDGALLRNSQIQKSRTAEAEDMQNVLAATRSCFRHTALDYVHSISLVQAKKRHEVLSTVSVVMCHVVSCRGVAWRGARLRSQH